MRNLLFTMLLSVCSNLFAQTQKPEDFGFRYLKLSFNEVQTDVLVLSKKGEEDKVKPLFLFCQGSLPIPLIITDSGAPYPSFPFATESLSKNFHLAIIGKPGIPAVSQVSALQNDFSYIEKSTGMPPAVFLTNNELSFYVKRNLAVVDELLKQKYVAKGKIVVAGHSQGARIAFEMCASSKKITHLIYAAGNPCGQIMSMISRTRQRENPADTNTFAENDFSYYQAAVADSNNTDITYGESLKSLHSFSSPIVNRFPTLNIPILISYGTYDSSALLNDYLRTEIIRKRKTNFTFNAYIGLDHNFFGMKETGEVDYDNFNWDKVALDWQKWLGIN